MKTIDILNKRFSILVNTSGYVEHQGLYDYTQSNLTLKQIIDLGYKYRKPIDKLRAMPYHSPEQIEYKKKFPCWLVGGVFPTSATHDNDILCYSNVLAIDIDKKDNPDININELKEKLFKLPYVAMVSNSISDKGIYALVLVEDGRYTKEYYTYITKLWNKTYNLRIDTQCKNIARKRYISYDDNLLLKDDDTEIKTWKLKMNGNNTQQKTEYTPMVNCSKYKIDNNNSDLAHKAIWYLLNHGYSIDDFNCKESLYSVWYHIGCDFRHFDDGEDMFIKFSNNSSKYNDNINDIKKKWDNTTTETPIEDVNRKWCGICKRLYGSKWVKIINDKTLDLFRSQ